MHKYNEELKLWKNPINKSIIFVEKWISTFGTNYFKALGWILVINISFALINIFVYSNFNWVSLGNFLQQLGVEFTQLIFVYIRYSTLEDLCMLRWTHYIALFLNPILLYELIKSARKFSRRF